MLSTYIRVLILAAILLIVGCNEEKPIKISTNSDAREAYQEKHRPQFHFSPEAKWMNDPNGMFYHKGKYHLFYQFYPDSTVWGPMHWGHTESKDLVHWKQLPIALYPDSLGLIFSGGAVFDKNNTSKLGTKDNPPVVATFTHHDLEGEKSKKSNFQKQSIAYSVDGGTEWIKYKHNPVIANTENNKDFRDPKVVWHEQSQKWVMVLAVYDRVKFYASKNLIDWQYISEFGIEGDNRLWECPDLFPIKVQGTNEEKWVLLVSIQKEGPNGGTGTSYFVGEFDGNEFKSDIKSQKWLDWGADNYAFVTWNNLPKNDGRILGIGWMSNWQYAQIVPTVNWRSAMTLPRELKLFKSESEYSLYNTPVKELESLRADSISMNQISVNKTQILKISPTQSEIILNVDLKETTATSFGIELQNSANENLLITFDKSDRMLYVDRTNSGNNKFSEDFFKKIHSAPMIFDKDTMKIHVFIDTSSLEIFIDDGLVSFTDIFFPSSEFDKISLFTENGEWNIIESNIYALDTIWNKSKDQN